MHNSADAINKAKMKWRKIAPKKPDKEEEEEKLYAHPYIRGCAVRTTQTLHCMLCWISFIPICWLLFSTIYSANDGDFFCSRFSYIYNLMLVFIHLHNQITEEKNNNITIQNETHCG